MQIDYYFTKGRAFSRILWVIMLGITGGLSSIGSVHADSGYAWMNFAGIGRYGYADGTGSAARFYEPGGVAVDANGNLYVADTNNCTIRMVTPGGVVTTLAGSPRMGDFADGTGSAARFNAPFGVAVDGNGNIYVADT